MSFAIGLGGFMDGFAKGQQIRQGWENEERKKVADERAKVLADRQDVEYNRAIAQRTEIDKINADAKTTFDAQVNAGTQQPGDFDQFWNKFALPKMRNTYLANGDIENADRVQKWGETEDAKTGARLFAGAITKAQTGDYAGALNDTVTIAGLKGYGNNPLKGLRYEPIVREAGGPAVGMRIYATGPDGKESYSDVPNDRIPDVIARFANPEAAWESQRAARAAADKDAGELRQYEEKKKIDKQYGVGDNKHRGDAITSLRKRFDGGLGGTDKKFDDMSAEEKEKLIDQEVSLQRGDGQVGLAGVGAKPPTERKVLVDTATGKPVQQAQGKAAPAKTNDRRVKDDEATSQPKTRTIGGVSPRAQEGVTRRFEDMKAKAAASGGTQAANAPSPEQALAQANAALEQGVPAERIGAALSEAGIPEWQWPKAVQEQLRSRQVGIGLNP
ncbi:hypothetical protein ASD74_06185 [Rhizobium sp. Root564]|nr:hypothetical protein ASD74_06185 [Rhizobium sp. Root564]